MNLGNSDCQISKNKNRYAVIKENIDIKRFILQTSLYFGIFYWIELSLYLNSDVSNKLKGQVLDTVR